MSLSVCCVMLASGRPEMARRAAECFASQTHPNKWLLVYDNGDEPLDTADWPDHYYVYGPKAPIGQLRNAANQEACYDPHCLALYGLPDLICHWDSDDWSHPRRLEEQVALIESSWWASAAGYSDLLFWDSRLYAAWTWSACGSAIPPDTSLIYRTWAWERKPFERVKHGEVMRWLTISSNGRALPKCVTVSSFAGGDPRMIAEVHGENSATRILPKAVEWRRASEFDEFCRETMKIWR